MPSCFPVALPSTIKRAAVSFDHYVEHADAASAVVQPSSIRTHPLCIDWLHDCACLYIYAPNSAQCSLANVMIYSEFDAAIINTLHGESQKKV